MRRYFNFICGIFLLLILVSCQQLPHYQGYVEGNFRYIASNYQGILENLLVKRGDRVKAYQTLFILNQESETADLQNMQSKVIEIEAQIKQNQANLELTQATYERYHTLIASGAIAQQTLDTAQSNFLQAQAQLKNSQAVLNAAQAEVAKAQWTQKQKTMAAPVDSLVVATYYLPGEQVPANRPVLSLLSDGDIKIIFYVPETSLAKIVVGETINIDCDACAKNLTAKINFIAPQAEYTPYSVYTKETRDKLVYRIEAVPNAQAASLHPGQPVMITLGKS